MDKKFDLKSELQALEKNGWILNKDLKETEITAIQNCIDKCTSPSKEDIFNALKFTKLSDVKVLILGQDPYPNKDAAHGYAFSCKNKKQPTLTNIFRAIDDSYNKKISYPKEKYNLEHWATQGILLLNSALTFEKSTMIYKHRITWEPVIRVIINKLIKQNKPLTVMLWGSNAQTSFWNSITENPFSSLKLRDKRMLGNVTIYHTSHPSNKSLAKGFKKDAPKYFKECKKQFGEIFK